MDRAGQPRIRVRGLGGDGHVGAVAGATLGDCQPNAARGTGDKQGSSFQAHDASSWSHGPVSCWSPNGLCSLPAIKDTGAIVNARSADGRWTDIRWSTHDKPAPVESKCPMYQSPTKRKKGRCQLKPAS